jgi:hypothetical protein
MELSGSGPAAKLAAGPLRSQFVSSGIFSGALIFTNPNDRGEKAVVDVYSNGDVIWAVAFRVE